MEWTVWILPTLGASIGTWLTVRERDGRPPQRRHLFETADGDRAAPFETLADGASARSPTCCRCERDVSAATFRYCRACLSEGA
ncbi:hypothetical protein ACOZ4L_05155 [Haloplanus ruber]|uniref:Zinc ribbon domain-containing protein n=1 Tax=Haloplanus ruber TaxID=869892 RepID=A0ABD6D1N5_9EURY|nr:hypothetical protein [Haloplanus ruber]